MATTQESGLWERMTLTGMTLKDAYATIDKNMGEDAYKPVKIGGQQFTDIKPPHVYELMTECFGPLGIGWGFEVVTAEYIGFRTYKAKSGNEVTEHAATASVTPWYRLADSDARYSWGPVPGGGKNSERNYAESGAVTNALGKALSFLGVQRHVYKNADPTMQPAEEEAANLRESFKTVMQVAKDNEKIEAVKAELGVTATGQDGIKAAFAIYEAMSDTERTKLAAIAAGTVER